MVASPQITTKSLLEKAKRTKKRVKAVTVSSNRENRRAVAKQTSRCSNTGRPMFVELATPEEERIFRIERSNKKIVNRLKYVMKNNIGYSSQMMKEAGKVVKSTAKKYSDEDKVKASKVTTRLGKYPNLVCLEDIASKIQKVV